MWRVAAALLLALAPGAGASAEAAERAGFLTGPSAEDPLAIALAYLHAEQVARGVPEAALARWQVTDRYRRRRDGVTHLYLRQVLGGIPVYNGTVALAVAPDGRLAGLRVRAVDPERAEHRPRAPRLAAAEAVERGAAALGHEAIGPLTVLDAGGGPQLETHLDAPDLVLEPISASLVYLERADGEVRLAWRFDLRVHDVRFWWELLVDADTGELLRRHNRVRNDQYRVFASPLESPEEGARTLEVDPADPNASPFGWHDTDGASGAEFTSSQGNNAYAAENAATGPSVNLAEGGAALSFDFPFDPNAPPDASQDAAVTNLFYWNNVLHDIHLQYGFDEAAGNFQEVHYGPDPTGEGDGVTAFAQDFNDTNNASMATPADGSSPTMRMHVFSVPVLRTAAPAAIAGRYEAGDAEFGPGVTTQGTSGSVVVALDAPDPNDPNTGTTDACSPLGNGAAVSGRIALVHRGNCNFIDKVDHAETAGAIGVIVVNNVPGAVFTMSKPQGGNPKIDIPSVLIRKEHGALITGALADGDSVTAVLERSERDSDFDAGVIVHEYGHGVSTRLTGGPANASCLLSGQAAGMGEGWSDFWALALTAKAGQSGPDPRGVGAYLVGEPGLRNFLYSTDVAINPQTFRDVDTTNAPHGIGEIWALGLWELYWNLVTDLGFDPDLYRGTGGNNVALQLATDALALQPCDPSFVDARDAVLLADAMGGGAHACRIWRAFAKRGLGDGADSAPDPSTGLVTESFAVPPACPLCGDANVDGLVDADDPLRIRTELAFPGTLSPGELADCSDRAFSGTCGLLESVILRRGLAGLPPGLSGSCSAVP